VIFQRDWIFVISHNVKMWYYRGHCDFSSIMFVYLTHMRNFFPHSEVSHQARWQFHSRESNCQPLHFLSAPLNPHVGSWGSSRTRRECLGVEFANMLQLGLVTVFHLTRMPKPKGMKLTLECLSPWLCNFPWYFWHCLLDFVKK